MITFKGMLSLRKDLASSVPMISPGPSHERTDQRHMREYKVPAFAWQGQNLSL